MLCGFGEVESRVTVSRESVSVCLRPAKAKLGFEQVTSKVPCSHMSWGRR